MSATRDKSHKIGFVYSNLYQIYRKGKEAAQAAEIPAEASTAQSQVNATPVTAASPGDAESSPGHAPGLTFSKILKAGSLDDSAFAHIKVNRYEPASFLGKRTESRGIIAPIYADKPEALLKSQNEALTSLKQNLQALGSLHDRLQFMLKELEELVKES